MSITARVYLCLCFMLMFITPGISSAQPKTLAQSQTELVSSWLVTVEGEDRTRTLRISGATQKSCDTLHLEAVYGWTDENQTPISASLVQSGQEVKLFLSTQSGSKVAATQASNGTFEGTFTLTNGTAKRVKVQKVSEEELQARIATAKAATASPAACDMSHLQGKPAWPDPGRFRLTEIFAAAPEADASAFNDGLIMDRCALMKVLVGTKVSGLFPGLGQYTPADEVHVFYPDGRFIKHLKPRTFAEGTYEVAHFGNVPVIRWKVTGDFTMQGGYAFTVTNKKLVGFTTVQGKRHPTLIQGE